MPQAELNINLPFLAMTGEDSPDFHHFSKQSSPRIGKPSANEHPPLPLHARNALRIYPGDFLGYFPETNQRKRLAFLRARWNDTKIELLPFHFRDPLGSPFIRIFYLISISRGTVANPWRRSFRKMQSELGKHCDKTTRFSSILFKPEFIRFSRTGVEKFCKNYCVEYAFAFVSCRQRERSNKACHLCLGSCHLLYGI